GGGERNGQAHTPRRAPRRLRRADRGRRPGRPRARRRSTRGDVAVDGAHPRARRVTVSATLLAIDGDSFAHRAYHSMPKSVRLNAVVGFGNMVSRLWEQEQPDAVLVGWDTLEVPTYRHEAYEPYQSGRVFEDSIVEQLAILPQLTEKLGFFVGKAPGYEADDFLAASTRAWKGSVLVATSDRDA